ncbi:MAG: LysR family transcriptional regulator [Oscillospiraceae bacterium]|nr:LysR family transcriptional regulator [Oscillospiraceae bacterium]
MMNLTNVQTFLRVVYCNSLTQAANELFVSQPTVTARLQQLEQELDTTLLRRGKGVRTIELTPQGRAFVPLAERWVALELETGQFKSQQVQMPLSIACLDSINLYVLAPLFRDLTRQYPDLRLNLRTHQSYEIFSLVENHEVDFGFSYILSRHSSVVCEALFSENMALIANKASFPAGATLTPEELDPSLEIFVPWSQQYILWHNDWWDPRKTPLVQADLASMIPLYLDHPGSWAICPYSAARAFLQANADLQVLQLSCPIPRRICYLLSSKTGGWTEPAAAKLFREKLQTYLENADWLDKL